MQVKFIIVTGHPARKEKQNSFAKKFSEKNKKFIFEAEDLEEARLFPGNEFFSVKVLTPKGAWQTKTNHPESKIISLELKEGEKFNPPTKREKDLFDKDISGLALFKDAIDYRVTSDFNDHDVQNIVDKILKK